MLSRMTPDLLKNFVKQLYMILYVPFSTLMTFETTVPQLETRLIHSMQTGASDLSLQMVRKRVS